MKKINKKSFIICLSAVCVVLAAVCTFCTLAGQSSDDSGQDSAKQTAVQLSPSEITLVQGDITVLNISAVQNEILDHWTSSDESVAAVDSGGRVDAVGVGSAVVSAVFDNGSADEFSVTVTEADDDADSSQRSTCITANLSWVEKNKENSDVNLYYIGVNRKENCVTVYTYDNDGNYTVPVRAMVCSTGAGNATITGSFTVGIKSEWLALEGDVYGRYISGISGDYLFHSVPYYTTDNGNLESDEFNKLGEQASAGCVRLAVADAKWIYENCDAGTGVYIYDSSDPGPLGKPDTIKISDTSIKWDPTDEDESSSYADSIPSISGAQDVTLNSGDSYNVLTGVTAADTCGNDITSEIEVEGNVVTSRKGTYKVTYSVTDAIKQRAEVTITVTVK